MLHADDKRIAVTTALLQHERMPIMQQIEGSASEADFMLTNGSWHVSQHICQRHAGPLDEAKHMRMLAILSLLALVACTNPAVKLAGPFPTGDARNPNGTVPLNGDGNYVYNRATGSFSRFSSDPRCFTANRGENNPGCFEPSAGGAGAPSK